MNTASAEQTATLSSASALLPPSPDSSLLVSLYHEALSKRATPPDRNELRPDATALSDVRFSTVGRDAGEISSLVKASFLTHPIHEQFKMTPAGVRAAHEIANG